MAFVLPNAQTVSVSRWLGASRGPIISWATDALTSTISLLNWLSDIAHLSAVRVDITGNRRSCVASCTDITISHNVFVDQHGPYIDWSNPAPALIQDTSSGLPLTSLIERPRTPLQMASQASSGYSKTTIYNSHRCCVPVPQTPSRQGTPADDELEVPLECLVTFEPPLGVFTYDQSGRTPPTPRRVPPPDQDNFVLDDSLDNSFGFSVVNPVTLLPTPPNSCPPSPLPATPTRRCYH